MRKSFVVIVFLAFCPLLVAQQAFNNDSVIKLVKAGLSEDLIISTINGDAGNFDTSAEGLIALKTAGASDKEVAAIVVKASPTAQTAPSPILSQPVQAAVASPVIASSVAPPAPPPEPFHSTDGKVRLYVTDNPMFESNGIGMASANRHGASAAGVSHVQAGDDPRTVEIQADILKVCPSFIMASNNPDRADYELVFRRRGGARSSMFAFGGLYGLAFSAAMKVDGASLFENNGDMVYATKQNTVEKSIKDICAHVPAPTSVAAPAAAPSPTPASSPI